MSTNEHNKQSDQSQPIVELPGDERDVLLSRIIDGVATGEDWSTFRAAATHDSSIWSDLGDMQQEYKALSTMVDSHLSVIDQVELPGGLIDDQPMRARLEMISRWGGWAAAGAILMVWFFGNPSSFNSSERINSPQVAGMLGGGILLDQAKPNQAFDQYLQSGQSTGQVIGEMPEQIVIETRPMPDGTIEVLYLRQIIERQIIDHAYREMYNDLGQVTPVPVKLSPPLKNLF